LVLIGGGSNVVFPDGFSPLVVIVNRTRRIEMRDGGRIRIESGATIRRLLGWCIKNRVGGLEFLAGIPGTVGGAVAVNAGAFGRSISQVFLEAEVIDGSGKIKRVGPEKFSFSYRNSRFKTGDQIISAVYLQGKDGDPDEIRLKIRKLILHRKVRHPSSNRYTAGCFFKNPTVGDDRVSAGKIIADLGFLGKKFKQVGVSSTHGNFLINTGGGTCEDIQALERQIVESVRNQTNIGLEREVIYISPDGKKY
jgi:UDP-N-acetylmuramate dehydrogenase